MNRRHPLDAAAQAIYETLHAYASTRLGERWDTLPPPHQRQYHNAARAALAALRDPTAAMLDAAQATACTRVEAWRAMIDAALLRPPGETR